MKKNNKKVDEIRYLMEEVRNLEMTQKNKDRMSLWEYNRMFGLNHWRSIPKARSITKRIPIIVELENEFWAKILGIDFLKIYEDPVEYFIFQLKKRIKKFEIIDDDTLISKVIPIFLGSGFESAIFGQESVKNYNFDPAPHNNYIIVDEHDIERIAEMDFYNSDIMKKAHYYYETLSELADSDFEVQFPEFARSPIAVSMHIRGMENLLCDMMTEQDFALRLIREVARARNNWWKEYSLHFKKSIPKQNIMNDEVNTPFLSPELYMKYAFPYEKEISEKYGIKYWHSCGNTTDLIECIDNIGSLDVFHVGPWTDIKNAVNVLGSKGTALEICINPEIDVLNCKNPLAKIRQIIDTCGNDVLFYIRSDGHQSLKSYQQTLKAIIIWLNTIKPLLVNNN